MVKGNGPWFGASFWVCSGNPLRFVRRHPPHHLSPAEQTTRQGVIQRAPRTAPEPAQQRSDQGQKPVISEQDNCWKGPKSCLPYHEFESPGSWVRFGFKPVALASGQHESK